MKAIGCLLIHLELLDQTIVINEKILGGSSFDDFGGFKIF